LICSGTCIFDADDKFGPSNLAQVAADFDEQSQRASHAPGRPIATFVHGTRGPALLMPLADMPVDGHQRRAVRAGGCPAQHPGSFAPSNGSQRLSRRITNAQN
jgi:hypothetical protein